MNSEHTQFITSVIDQARDLTLATVRPDGYPQATTVSFAHDGLVLYVGVGMHSQKADNIRQNDKVSLTITLPYQDWRDIRGVSMAAHAAILSDPAEISRAGACLLRRFPQALEWAGPNMAAEIAFLKISPKFISVIDYSKGFGHTELVCP
jgi:nitroimidazol reductase NimA-like FMN-containing flavoprotein (pyridoxamine 5'-phosphate oxidase superfamily)